MEVALVMLTNTTILFHRPLECRVLSSLGTFQVIKELYIQETDPSARIMSSAVQNQNECYTRDKMVYSVAALTLKS